MILLQVKPFKWLTPPPKIDRLVTIAIPVFRRTDYLFQAIDSALGQNSKVDFNVMVVDNDPNGSVANLVVAKYSGLVGVCVNAENYGMVGNWNQCLSIPTSAFVSILHDDDLLGPHFLSLFESIVDKSRYSFFSCRTDVGERPGFAEHFDSVNRRLIRQRDAFFCQVTPFPGVIVNRNIALAIGGFDVDYHPCADCDFWIRLAQVRPGVKLDSCQAFYRVSGGQTSRDIVGELVDGKVRVCRRHAKSIGFSNGLLLNIYCATVRRRLRFIYKKLFSPKKISTISHILVRCEFRLYQILDYSFCCYTRACDSS